MTVGILLLAAGESTRYRAACGRHKLLEPVEGEPMLVRDVDLPSMLSGEK
ncbi:hypothetical protein [Mixta theicola]|nr:hypothetical protein [Mixta theicola]GLR08994.1 hypothetical protein GCM10007905_17140 [Mixta theicola]